MIKVYTVTLLLFLLAVQPVLARSGCCSHHDGVRSDGCGCNDGTPLSSTCAPYYSCQTAPVQELQQAALTVQYIPPTYTPFPTAIPTRKPTPTNTPSPTLALTPTKKPVKTNPKPTPKPEHHWWDFLFGR